MKLKSEYIKSACLLSFLGCFLFITPAQSGVRGPEHRTLRPLAMGNAFVAVVDDKDALHYNPAGLNLINRLGNRKRRPEMGYYPIDRIDMHMNFVGVGIPLGTALDILKVYQDHEKTFTAANLEAFQNDKTLTSDLIIFDREPILLAVLSSGEFALHNFGMAYWADVKVSPFLDVGVMLPQAGASLQADAAGEIGIARSFIHDRLAIGVEYRMAVREEVKQMQLAIGDIPKIQDILIDTLQNHMDNISDFSRIGHGIDIGFLWQQTRSLRLGGAVQNLFMKLNNEPVDPKYTIGVCYSPMMLQNNYRWKRKINFAMDYEDMLNTRKGAQPLSKLNFGSEWEQTLIPYILKGRLSAGVKGGYWTAGLGGNLFTILHYEFATWAEEGGYFTGQKEDRYYVMNFGIGL